MAKWKAVILKAVSYNLLAATCNITQSCDYWCKTKLFFLKDWNSPKTSEFFHS